MCILFLFSQWEWNNSVVYFVFRFFFGMENKWRLHTTYPKREVPLKALKDLFVFRGTFVVSHRAQAPLMSGFLMRSTPWPWSGLGGRWKVELPCKFGLGTKLGLLVHSLTCIGLHTRLWVQSLGTTWEGVRHPRPPSLRAGLHYVLLGRI